MAKINDPTSLREIMRTRRNARSVSQSEFYSYSNPSSMHSSKKLGRLFWRYFRERNKRHIRVSPSLHEAGVRGIL